MVALGWATFGRHGNILHTFSEYLTILNKAKNRAIEGRSGQTYKLAKVHLITIVQGDHSLQNTENNVHKIIG